MILLAIHEIAAYYGQRLPELNQRGRRWRGRCPIHRGDRDNFDVDPVTGLWRCWSKCGRGGDIVVLEMALTGAPWREAVVEIESIIGRVLLDRRMSRAERCACAAYRRAAKPAAGDIANWRDALIQELNARKIAAVEAGDDHALTRAASVCNLLENGSPADFVREFIRHRASDPADVARLIALGRERDLEAQLIAAEVVLILARATAEDSSDAA